MHPREPAKPLHDAQMCGSFYFYTMSNRIPFQKPYASAHDLVRLLHPEKAPSLILVTLLGIVTDVRQHKGIKKKTYFE